MDPYPNAVLHPCRMNKNVIQAEYAVRGELYAAALKRKAEGKEVIFTNVGNPHALGQKPLTFPRQVLALCSYPQLLEINDTNAELLLNSKFPRDVIARARQYLSVLPGGTGAYQDSRGNAYIRQEIAHFITKRDSSDHMEISSQSENIFITDGASPGIQLCLRCLIRDRNDGILLPIPQYPLYTASVALMGGTKIGYYLNEEEGWSLQVKELKKSVQQAREKGIVIRAIVIINPGNPTGQILSMKEQQQVLQFCYQERIVLLADEVYQANVYGGRKFVSFKKALYEMSESDLNNNVDDNVKKNNNNITIDDIRSKTELISFHTVSKGAWGECGRRGGYFECCNIHPQVMSEMYKIVSMNLSTNVDGQIFVGIMCNPPQVGDESYPLFQEETTAILQSLGRRAQYVTDAFNSIPGITCEPVNGALYAFPKIILPEQAIIEAKRMGKPPSVIYCLELLDKTGICVVPGAGFDQKPGTYHFRTTILSPEVKMLDFVSRFKKFHQSYMARYNVNNSKNQNQNKLNAKL